MMSYIVKAKQITDEEIKEAHRKKLLELSLKSIGRIPQLDEPTEEQVLWINKKMKRGWSK